MAGDWAASALKWWQDAGVDTIVGETPRDWLAPAAAAAGPHPPTRSASGPILQPGGPSPGGSFGSGLNPERERDFALPDTLEAFQAWWLAGDLGFAPSAGRVGPSGDPGSGLMVLIDMPSAADIAAGVLLSGEAGALFDRMMAAIGRGRDSLYLASLAPARTPAGTLDAASTKRLAEIARHHVGLVQPKALLLFGDACAKALLGAPVAQTRGKWHELATSAGKISTLVTIRPENLLPGQTAMRKMAWEDLQMLGEVPNT
jgi:uracil-DNA glycosylase family 4